MTARIVRGDVRAFCRLHKALSGGSDFSFHVAAMADGNKVRQAVRGFVISTKYTKHSSWSRAGTE